MILKFSDGAVLDTVPNFNGHIVTIKDSNPNTSGFRVYNKGIAIFDATAFRTVYDKDDESYTLSDDGSVKPEPPIPPVPPAPPEPVYTEVTLTAGEESAEATVIDFSNTGDITFYVSREIEPDFLSELTEIEVGDEVIDLTEDYAFQTCEAVFAYDTELYYVAYHKFTEQELVNKQVMQNTANIDYIAMETDIEL